MLLVTEASLSTIPRGSAYRDRKVYLLWPWYLNDILEELRKTGSAHFQLQMEFKYITPSRVGKQDIRSLKQQDSLPILKC